MNPSQRELRELKRTIKRLGGKRRRRELKRAIEVSPEEAHLAEADFGRYRSDSLNGQIDRDTTRMLKRPRE